MVKKLPASAEATGAMGLIPGWEKSGEGNDNPLQYSCLENPMDRGTWWVTVRGVAETWTQPSTHMCACIIKKNYVHILILFFPHRFYFLI